MSEFTTGTPNVVRNSRISSVARAARIPPPTRTRGRSARRKAPMRSSITDGSMGGSALGSTDPVPSTIGTSARWMSIGTSSRTGPGRPLLANWKDRRSIMGSCSGVSTCQAAFVMGAARETMSVSWKPICRIARSPFISFRFTWPVMKTAGVESK